MKIKQKHILPIDSLDPQIQQVLQDARQSMHKVLKRELPDYPVFVSQLFKEMDNPEQALAHAAIGLNTEAGEALDAVKKHWIYKQDLNVINLIEELGDLQFYVQALCNILCIDIEQLKYINMAKLSKRYPNLEYSDEHAKQRLDKLSESKDFFSRVSNDSIKLFQEQEKRTDKELPDWRKQYEEEMGHNLVNPETSLASAQESMLSKGGNHESTTKKSSEPSSSPNHHESSPSQNQEGSSDL